MSVDYINSKSQVGFDPPFAEGAEFTEWKTDALANQATTAGLQSLLLQTKLGHSKILLPISIVIICSKKTFNMWRRLFGIQI